GQVGGVGGAGAESGAQFGAELGARGVVRVVVHVVVAPLPLVVLVDLAGVFGGLFGAVSAGVLEGGDDVVDEAVFEGFGGGEPAVAVGVLFDAFEGLAGVLGDEAGHFLLGLGELFGLDGDVGRGAADAGGRLVHHDAGVRQGVALAGGAGGQQELAHGGREAHAVGGDVAGHELHGVVDGHAGGDGAARGVDVERDVSRGVFGREEEHLRAELVGDLVVDLVAEEQDALLQ